MHVDRYLKDDQECAACGAAGVAGAADCPNSPQGHETSTVRPEPGVSMLPLSSVARVLIVTGPAPVASHE